MRPHPWIIEERLKRERKQRSDWQPEPLHAPSPQPQGPSRREERDDQESGHGGRVIIIDMASGTTVSM
jgi:hypothetical protein